MDRSSSSTYAHDKAPRFLGFGIGASDRAIRMAKPHTRPTMRKDLMQDRRDGNHRALGRQPEAAQGLEMFDRPIGPSGFAALPKR